MAGDTIVLLIPSSVLLQLLSFSFTECPGIFTFQLAPFAIINIRILYELRSLISIEFKNFTPVSPTGFKWYHQLFSRRNIKYSFRYILHFFRLQLVGIIEYFQHTLIFFGRCFNFIMPAKANASSTPSPLISITPNKPSRYLGFFQLPSRNICR